MGDERIRRITTILLRDADDHGRQAVGASRDHHDYVRTALYDVVDTIATLTRERDEARARGIAEERARVVAMLRRCEEQAMNDGAGSPAPWADHDLWRNAFAAGATAFATAAEKVERGDHDAAAKEAET